MTIEISLKFFFTLFCARVSSFIRFSFKEIEGLINWNNLSLGPLRNWNQFLSIWVPKLRWLKNKNSNVNFVWYERPRALQSLIFSWDIPSKFTLRMIFEKWQSKLAQSSLFNIFCTRISIVIKIFERNLGFN